MLKKYMFLVLLAAIMGAGITLTQAHAEDGNMLSLGVGIYDIGGNEDEATDFRLEHRWGQKLWWEIKPFVGGELTSDASFWVGGGLYADFNLTDNVLLTPSFGVGFYDEGDSDLDLGYPVEFRSQIEAAYEFQNQNRLGVGYGHISNASLDENNPGTEILNLYWHIPY